MFSVLQFNFSVSQHDFFFNTIFILFSRFLNSLEKPITYISIVNLYRKFSMETGSLYQIYIFFC